MLCFAVLCCARGSDTQRQHTRVYFILLLLLYIPVRYVHGSFDTYSDRHKLGLLPCAGVRAMCDLLYFAVLCCAVLTVLILNDDIIVYFGVYSSTRD